MKFSFYFKHTVAVLLAGLTSVAVTAKTTTTTSTASNTSNVTTTAPAVSQPFLLSPDYSHTWWLNFGLGAGGISGDDDSVRTTGPAGELSFNYAVTNHQLFTLRTASISQTFFGSSAHDVGALYGVMNKTDRLLTSLSAGLAYTKVNNVNNIFDSSFNTSKTTVGVPLETQLFWTPTQYFGVGVIGFGNINSTKSFGGVLLAIQLGKLN